MSIANKMGLTPVEIVTELNRFIVGQDKAKKAVAIALRNRYRRAQVLEPIKNEISPKNILMIGSTGVGKTEIARRLAKLASAPFIKVEATKFTEVGYVGRDVDSIIRDLIEIAISAQKDKARKIVFEKARDLAIERVLDVMVGDTASEETKDKFKEKISNGELYNTEIEIEVKDNTLSINNGFDIPGMPNGSIGVLNINDLLGKATGGNKTKQKKMTIKHAIKIITAEESDKMIDDDKIILSAIYAVENDAIIFLDEIDKITSRGENRGGEVSREGVQRDLLPLIEGTNVVTKYGAIKTDHILFIASGAFHLSKPSDLLPELQGRLPIKVEMNSLKKEDFIKILTEPECSLIKQHIALLSTEGVTIEFTECGIDEIAEQAEIFNFEVECIGARRLHTVLEKIIEDISFEINDFKQSIICINRKFVQEKLNGFIKNRDFTKYIL